MSLGTAANAADPEFGNITDTKGSLQIHKHESGSHTNNQAGTPDGKTNVGGKGVPGVKFKAYKITDLDLLNDNGAWTKVSTLNVPANACDAPSLAGHNLDGGKESGETDGNGDASIDDLSVGAYLVCETQAPSTVIKKAAPFVVTVPFPDKDASKGWLYNVHVYPKNTVAEAPVKTVEVLSNGLQNDGQVKYTVSGKVPSLAADEYFKYFTLADPMSDAHKDIAISKVEISTTTDANGAYEDVPAANYTKDVQEDKHWAAVQFMSTEGLAYLKGKAGHYVRMTITAKVDKLPDQGKLNNKGYLLFDSEKGQVPPTPPNTPPVTPPDTPDQPPVTPPNTPPATPTNKTVTSWGDALIRKYDAGKPDKSKALAGATFQVYNAADPYAADCKNEIDPNSPNPITVAGKDSFVTEANGVAKIAGLFVDKAQGVGPADPVLEHAYRCYVIVETSAPAGFVLDATPRALKVEAGKSADTQYGVEVPNSKQGVPQLPLTGANGRLLMTIGGVAIILFACGAAFVARSRREREQD